MPRRKRVPAADPPAEVAFLPCTAVALPEEQWVDAAATAVAVNPANSPLMAPVPPDAPPLAPERIAFYTGRCWSAGMTLTVDWLDNPSAACRRLILAHFRAWLDYANLTVVESHVDPIIRVARQPGLGYWSYLGTDNLHIPRGQATMNLDSFTERTSDAEYRRVVRHEFGHVLGCPHEQQRAAIIGRLDREAVYRYFGGPPNRWSRAMIDAQILTPIAEGQLAATAADVHSIMCYSFGASLTVDHVAIPGGTDLTDWDKTQVAKIYPGRSPVVPPPTAGGRPALAADGAPLADQIARAGETDEFDLTIVAAGTYRVATRPAMVAGVFTPDGARLLARGDRQVDVQLDPGPYRVKVEHRYTFGTGNYRVTCRRVDD